MATSEFNTIVGNIKNISSSVTSGISKVKSIISDPGKNASAIRDKYLSGFLGDTTQFSPSMFPRLFDEPTYLTFRVEFNTSDIGSQYRNLFSISDIADSGGTSYDYLPEPLLAKRGTEIGVTSTENITTSKYEDTYSSISYLRDVLGERRRADLLEQLIAEIDDIQTNYPYYFTSVSGLDSLSKVNAEKGIRVPEGTKISIKCYEGLDLKITQLMQLYRKIAWDDVYQRWILPDMMRFFNVKIYVSEIRLFHTSSVSLKRATHGKLYDFTDGYNATIVDKNQLGSTGSILNTAGTILSNVSAVSTRLMGENNKFNEVLGTVSNTYETATSIYSDVITSLSRMCNNAINDVMPTICFDCHMCEFDLDNTLRHISTLNSANRKDSPHPEIVIKVGQVEEVQMYPLNGKIKINEAKDMYVLDVNKSPASYISDDDLSRDNTVLEDRHYVVGDGDVLDAFKISLPRNRVNRKMIDMEKDSYSKDGESREDAIRSLSIGAANVVDQYTDVFNSGRSTATNSGDAAKESAAIVNYRDKVPASSATQDGNRGTATPPDTKPGEATKDTGRQKNEIEEKDRSTATQDYYDEKVVADSSISSVATQIEVDAKKLIDNYDAITISAATKVLENARKSVLNNNVIASLYLTDDEKKRLAEQMYKNILLDIVQSPATASGLRDVAAMILDYTSNRDLPSTAVDGPAPGGIALNMPFAMKNTATNPEYNKGVDKGKVYSEYDDVEISHAVNHKEGSLSGFGSLNVPYASTATTGGSSEQIIDMDQYNGSTATKEGQERESAYEGDYDDIEMSHATHPLHPISHLRSEMPREAESTATEKYNSEHIGDTEYEISHATHATRHISDQSTPMPRELDSEAVDREFDQDSLMPEGVEISHATHAKTHLSDQVTPMPRELDSEAVDNVKTSGSAIDVEIPEPGTATDIYYNKTASREKILDINSVETSHATKSHKKFE